MVCRGAVARPQDRARAVAIASRKSGQPQPCVDLTCGAAAAAFLSADEVGIIHETLGTILEDAAKASSPGSVLHFIKGFPSYSGPRVRPIAIPLQLSSWCSPGVCWRRAASSRLFVFLYAMSVLTSSKALRGTDHQSFPIRFSRAISTRHLHGGGDAGDARSLFLTASLRHLAAVAERAAAATVDPGLLRDRCPAVGVPENPRQVAPRWAGLFAASTTFRDASVAPAVPERFVHSASEQGSLRRRLRKGIRRRIKMISENQDSGPNEMTGSVRGSAL
jgi:hypothetical protein